jgi:hypothetical protein
LTPFSYQNRCLPDFLRRRRTGCWPFFVAASAGITVGPSLHHLDTFAIFIEQNVSQRPAFYANADGTVVQRYRAPMLHGLRSPVPPGLNAPRL